ncbi:TetR/AcrR family transcriptional regulator [Streptomyces roseicoloratus]|uniref:TetR/AcrR family transcriptional regulator n=1 Tax=Streptomyces roseicoloratus TaxID=2508722 RepID=A0ABY9RUW2_9ACTN|nr:TetR/AcrR family transcriptional regulator [Streptomyces roseicoloratus]WMX45971.1 TetR/AcrR family transcriptional regulator [Streptomyces roseicoloratus]
MSATKPQAGSGGAKAAAPTPLLNLLPTVGGPAPERADAARNRRKILDAAARIVAEQGPEAVTMNQVAHASGIGVGTVYRRFGDVSQLLWALLDDRERQFQEAYLGGPPPLGPGAPAAQRLDAFLDALVDRVVEQREILLAAQTAAPSARYTSGAYLAMHTHLALLVSQAHPTANAPLLAHLLLAPFSPSLMHHLSREQHLSADELKAGIRQLLSLDSPATST